MFACIYALVAPVNRFQLFRQGHDDTVHVAGFIGKLCDGFMAAFIIYFVLLD
jgi:hypothetical protein